MHGTAQDNNTPLHFAAFKGHASIVMLLLERGADMAAKDEVRRAARPRLHRST
jgi:ankyrin repeat protein